MTSVIRIKAGVPAKHQNSVHYHKEHLAKIDINRVSCAGHDHRTSSSAGLKQQKRVRFQTKEKHTLAHIPRWRDLPDHQLAEIWWSQDAMDDLEREWKFAVYRINNGEVPEDGEARGLEQHTENGAWEYYSAQARARNTVLEEQDRRSSDEEIADAYSSATIDYVQQAIERAERDAKEAKANRLRKKEATRLILEASKIKLTHNNNNNNMVKKSNDMQNEHPSKSLHGNSTKKTAPRSSRSPKRRTQINTR